MLLACLLLFRQLLHLIIAASLLSEQFLHQFLKLVLGGMRFKLMVQKLIQALVQVLRQMVHIHLIVLFLPRHGHSSKH